MYSQYNMSIHSMKLNKNIKNLKFMIHIPYKIYNLNLSHYKNLSDNDFIHLICLIII